MLAIGEPARVIGEAEILVGQHPLRERIWRQLMLALYREGRQADALTAYQRVREILADELGIDPSPELARLHERILKQDPGLELRGEPLRGYRLLEKIDDGPTGVVFRAIQPRVGRDVAVKIFHEQVASDPAFVRRFEQEAQAAAALEHPHIVPVYDYWREPGRAYIVSRYLKGGSLAALESRGDRLAQGSGSLVVEQVASALGYAHRQHVAHGRVCASNVLFDGERNAYLGDFQVGVGTTPDPADDVREFASLARGVLDDDAPPRLRELIERTNLGAETPGAEAFADAARASFEQETVPTVRTDDVRNPYKGLRPFSEADAHDFFGRTELTARLIGRLGETGRGSRFLAVVGPSGAGKSSVVRAGMVPAIRQGALGDPQACFVAEMFPGVHPIEELEQALLRIGTHPASQLHDLLDRDSRGLLEALVLVLPEPATLVLVVDQFEEVFTLTADEHERELFLESLRVAASDPESRLRVIVTLRADFYDRPLMYPRLGELLAARTEAVPPLTPDELEQAIRRPAEEVGITAEPGLVAEVIADLAHQPGSLPLLQYALTELFERREGDRLTLSAFEEIGGVGGALSARADRIFATTGPDGQRAIRQVFLRLVTIGEGRQDTRRRVTRSELDALDVDPELIEMTMDTYGRHRLLTFDREPATREPTVEIAHEALLVAWTRLRVWIDDAREDLRQDRRLSRAAGEWRGSDRDPSFVLRGARLEQVETWAAATDLAIGRPEREYMKASVDVRDREMEEERARRAREERTERRSRSRLRALVAVLAVAAVVAATLTVLATGQRGRADREATKAQDEARVATARELANAAVSNLEADPELSILLAMESIDRTRSVDGTVLPEAKDALHQAVVASRIEVTMPGVGGEVAWSQQGMLAAASAEGEGIVEIRDAETGARVRSLQAHDGAITGLAFSRTGAMLATTGGDGMLKVWDSSSGELLSRVRGAGEARAPAFDVHGVRVGADWVGIDTVRIANPITGHVKTSVAVPPGVVAFDPDLRRIVVVSRRAAVVLDLETGRGIELRGSVDLLEDYGGSLAWSPDGRWIAVGSTGWANIFDARTGRSPFSLPHNEFVSSLAWSRNSTRVVTGGSETAKVWEIEKSGPEQLISLPPAIAPSVIASVAFSPDGTRILTSDADGTVAKIFDIDISGDAEVANLPATPNFGDVEFMPDGVHVARQVSEDRFIAIWDLETGRTVRRIGPPGSWSYGFTQAQFEVSPDGASIAAMSGDGEAGVWDIASGDRLFAIPEDELVSLVDWSPDGKHVIMASLHGWARILDRTGRTIQVLREDDGYEAVGATFSSDGRFVALSASPDGEVPNLEPRTKIWDVERGQVVSTIVGNTSGWSAFSLDGSRIVTTTDPAGPATVWDVMTGTLLAVLDGVVTNVDYSPDGSRIAAAMRDDTVRLFDASSGEQLLVLRGHDNPVAFVDFSPDGTMLVSGAADTVVRVWALHLDHLLEIARRELTRSLTDEECRQYLHLERCPAGQ